VEWSEVVRRQRALRNPKARVLAALLVQTRAVPGNPRTNPQIIAFRCCDATSGCPTLQDLCRGKVKIHLISIAAPPRLPPAASKAHVYALAADPPDKIDHHDFGLRLVRLIPAVAAYCIFRRCRSLQQSVVLQTEVSHYASTKCTLTNLYSELIYPRSFPPDARTNVPRPSEFGLSDYEELFIPTPDGESLSAFFIRANKHNARNVTILMFHGNAGNIGYRLPIAKVLSQDLRCNVLMLQYRGYGLSSGNPNEKGLMIDAQTGLEYIRQRSELRGTRIVLYGQSLGGAVSIGLASRNFKKGDISGLLLENTFTSMRKLIPR
jgi:hypothetical protein